MLAKVYSGAVLGINGYLITVEVDIAAGMPGLATVGLPDNAVREARERVVAAIRNCGFDFPLRKITVNLAPADIKKEGAAFDLPIAIGILAAAQCLSTAHLEQWCLAGELALDGSLRPVKGILPIALEAKERKMQGLICPHWNLPEASVVDGLKIVGAHSLKEAVTFLNQEKIDLPDNRLLFDATLPDTNTTDLDFADVKGQSFAKRALEVACSGGHNVIMIGPPGSGKTMLSKRAITLLPPLQVQESVQTTKIHSVAGLLTRQSGLIRQRPFRAPHHTISHIALIGGGQHPRPGEVSLAHNGVLFLDELPEFHRNVLEVLRQPLESGQVVIARAKETLTFPAQFMLLAAMNPCPCGFNGHPTRACRCTPIQIQKYMGKISGPLLDRIDIHLEVPALKIEELSAIHTKAESSQTIRARVLKTQALQADRFKGQSSRNNAQMSAQEIKKFCVLRAQDQQLLTHAVERLSLSARAYDRILKVARTIADMAESLTIQTEHLSEAIQYRALDKNKE